MSLPYDATETKAARAKFHLRPSAVFDCLRCDDSVMVGKPSGLIVIKPSDLATIVKTPVSRSVPHATLRQTVREHWHRELDQIDTSDPPSFARPVVVSCGKGWHLRDDSIEIFDPAILVDGARRLEASISQDAPQNINVIVVSGLLEDEELHLRDRLSRQDGGSIISRHVERVGTSTPRIHFGTAWTTLELNSDPFTVMTSRGYAPAVVLHRDGASYFEHALIGARSLASELENYRLKYGTLRGLRVAIRKTSEDRTAPYEVRVAE